MAAQRGVEHLEYLFPHGIKCGRFNSQLTACNKQRNNIIRLSSAINSDPDLEEYKGVLGPSKKIIDQLKLESVSVSQSVGPETSNFRASIDTNDLSKINKQLSEESEEKDNSELLGEAVRLWIDFAKIVSKIGRKGAKVFVQMNEDLSTAHFLVKTDELLT